MIRLTPLGHRARPTLAGLSAGGQARFLGATLAASLAFQACVGDVELWLPSDGTSGSAGDTGLGGARGGEGGTGNAGAAAESGGGSGATGGSTAFGGAAAHLTQPPGPELNCSIELLRADLSPRIQTVGIVEFDADLPGVSAAFIQFGTGDHYDLEAPVELDEPGHRTLLLGNPSESWVHFRILLISPAGHCRSSDFTLRTGGLGAGGPSNAPIGLGTSQLPPDRGFIITSEFNGAWVYILDNQGRVVWYYKLVRGRVSRARLSYDGKYMYARNLNVGRREAEGFFTRVALDGSSELVVNLPTSHHDFTITPDGGVIYIRKDPDSTCDSIFYHPVGAPDASGDTELFKVQAAFPTTDPSAGTPLEGESCHTNSIHYHPKDESLTFSDLAHNAYVKISRAGEVQWVLGSADSSFTGPGTAWERQHGHHLLGSNRLLLFSNGTLSTKSSWVYEVALDPGAMTAEFDFAYASSNFSSVLGDVQRLPNGNTLISYSVSSGVFQEVDPSGELIQLFDMPGPTGYANHRPTLYGPPPEGR